MHHAIMFPRNVPVNEANLQKTSEVFVGSAEDELRRASDSRRLRCPGCLYPVFVQRSPAASGPVSHFRHATGADPESRPVERRRVEH